MHHSRPGAYGYKGQDKRLRRPCIRPASLLFVLCQMYLDKPIHSTEGGDQVAQEKVRPPGQRGGDRKTGVTHHPRRPGGNQKRQRLHEVGTRTGRAAPKQAAKLSMGGALMNKQRRRELQNIIDEIDILKSNLEDIQNEEEYRDNIPENMQSSEKYEIAEAACDSMSEAIDNLEEAIGNIESAIEG